MPKPSFIPAGMMSTITLNVAKGRVESKEGNLPLAGATATLESETTAYKGVTAARVVAIGVFALAAKKDKVRTSSVLLIEAADGKRLVRAVPEKKLDAARGFVAQVNEAASVAV